MTAHQISKEPQLRPTLEVLQLSPQLLQATLDTLSPHIALLDTSGTIIAVNAAWRRFAEANQLNTPFYGVRTNYLEICERASGPGQTEAFAVARGIREVLAQQRETFYLEYPCHGPEEQRWFVIRASRFEDSLTSGVVVVHENITERKQSEVALEKSEQRFRAAVEGSLDGFLLLKAERAESGEIIDFIFADMNDNAETQLFMSRKTLLGRRICEVFPINRTGGYFEKYKRVAETGEVLEEEFLIPETNALPGWWWHQVVPVADGVAIFNRDISEKKRAEQTIRESEERLRNLIEGTIQGILVHRNIQPLFANQAYARILGYESPDEILKIGSVLPLIAPYEQERLLGYHAARIQGQPAPNLYEYDAIRKDGSIVTLQHLVTSIIWEGEPATLTTTTDITERKQAEEILRQHEQGLQRRNRELALLNRVIAASAAGLEPETILEIVCLELAQAFDVPQAAAALLNEDKTVATVVAEYRAEGRPSALNDIIPIEGNPAAQYILSHKSPLVVEDAQNDPRLATAHELMRQRGTVSLLILPLIIEEEVIGSLGLDAVEPRLFSPEEVNLIWSVADQVAGALARARLGQDRRLLSAAVEQSAESVIITDTEGIIIYVNPTFEQISGYSRAEVWGQTPRFLRSGHHEAAFYEKLWATITAGQVWRGRLINRKKDESLYTIDTLITPVRDEHGQIINYVALQRDITRELHLEEQLRQSQKMEAIGRLAGGVAHDFNNLLTVIAGYVEFLLNSHYSPDDPRREDLEQIKQAGERAAMLTRQLLAFSRQQPSHAQCLNLNQIVANLETMLRRLIGEHIGLIIELAPDLGYIKADSGQIEQIIVNLAVNARDAMPGGGRLTLKTASVELDKAYTSQHLNVTPGPYVILAVTDTGVGIDVEARNHIFEPFFTTKGVGKGTGLGLSIVYGIIEQNGGHIEVESGPEQGTTFKIYLPQAHPAVKSVLPTVAPSPSEEGNETILLVEDEEAVRLITRRFLQKRGYRVLEASQAEDALHLCQHHEGRIDLLITDVVMPGISGPELAGQLTRLYSGLKVLYISGYADEELKKHRVQNTPLILLEKPFTSDALARKVREVLDKSQSGMGEELSKSSD